MSPSKISQIRFDEFHNIVDGKQRGASSTHNGINPVTQEKLWGVPVATQQDVDDAVASGAKAFKTWSKTTIEERKAMIQKFNDLYAGYQEEMTDLLAAETGKPRQFAAMEVGSVGMWSAHHLKLTLPEEFAEDDTKSMRTIYKPVGVCAGICPWNFPITLSWGKVVPALLTGCTIIIKPSPFTPYTALKIIELAQEVFPPGVVQALGGDDSLGPMLTAHPGIAKVSFTGSIATGKKIMASCAGTLKRVTLELGGNDAAVVLGDVDVQKTAAECAMGGWQNSGQVCVCTKRIYVHESIYRPFLDAMVAFTKTLKVGASSDEGVMLGPVQNKMQYDKVKGFFADSKAKGYNFAHGSGDVNDEGEKGYFINPAIIDNPPNDSRIIREEPFGPIVPVQPFTDIDEVIERVNDSNAGLGASVYGRDVKQCERIAEQLDVGSVWINSFEKPTPQAFFGGHKESGIGGEWGTKGLLSYCNAVVLHSYKKGPNVGP